MHKNEWWGNDYEEPTYFSVGSAYTLESSTKKKKKKHPIGFCPPKNDKKKKNGR